MSLLNSALTAESTTHRSAGSVRFARSVATATRPAVTVASPCNRAGPSPHAIAYSPAGRLSTPQKPLPSVAVVHVSPVLRFATRTLRGVQRPAVDDGKSRNVAGAGVGFP